MTKKEEWQKKSEASPHPGLKSLHCEVQLIPLSQCSQPVQAAALVVILQELNEALIDGESKKLASEHLIHGPLWPGKHYTRQKGGHIMVRHPPALDPGAIAHEDAFPYGQCAVVPHQQKVEDFISDTTVEKEEAGYGSKHQDYCHVKLELLILVFVGKFCLVAEKRYVHIAQDQIQVQPVPLWQISFHIKEEILFLFDLRSDVRYQFQVFLVTCFCTSGQTVPQVF